MTRFQNAISLLVATALCVISANAASAKSNGARLAGSDQTKTLNCAEGPARIAGSNNKVTLSGACTRLTILGSRNTVTVAFGSGGSVWFGGSKNEVIWTTPDGKEPKAHHLGYGNTRKQGQ